MLWVVTLQSAVTAQGPNVLSEVTCFMPQVAEAPGAAKCIGPGCSSVAQPDSVYCSSDCILKHAAAAMKFLSSGKEPKPKPKEKTKAKADKLTLPKGSAQVRRPRQPPDASRPRPELAECRHSSAGGGHLPSPLLSALHPLAEG